MTIRLYSDFSDEYLHRIAASYAPFGCFLLLCDVFEEEASTSRALQWLRNYRIEFGETVRDIVETLSPKEATILALRYGLVGPHTESLKEIGERAEFKLTRQGIHHVQLRAVRKLRHPLRSRKLRLLLDTIHDA